MCETVSILVKRKIGEKFSHFTSYTSPSHTNVEFDYKEAG